MVFQHSLLLLWMYVCVSKELLLAWLSLTVPLTSPCTPEHYSPHSKTRQSWYGFGLCCLRASLMPVCHLFVPQVLFFCAFCYFPILFLKGKVPPGCNLGPSPHLVLTHCEFWPHCIEGRLIWPSVVNWPHTLLIIANSLACFFFFVLSMSHFSPCHEGSSIWHLISWIFVLLFQGGCGSTYAEVHWGNSKRERQRGRDQSLSNQLQPTTIVWGSEDILPDTRKCHENAGIIDSVIYF